MHRFKIGRFVGAALAAAMMVFTPANASAQCAKCNGNHCQFGPLIGGLGWCMDYAPGLGCLAGGECGVTLTKLTPGGGMYDRVVTQTVVADGTTYLRGCSGALIAVRKTSTAIQFQRHQLSLIAI